MRPGTTTREYCPEMRYDVFADKRPVRRAVRFEPGEALRCA